jgi:hypothetical protein
MRRGVQHTQNIGNRPDGVQAAAIQCGNRYISYHCIISAHGSAMAAPKYARSIR